MNELSLFSKSENLMTTKELADILGVSERTIRDTAKNKGVEGSFYTLQTSGGAQSVKVYNQVEATIIKQEIASHHNLKSRQIDNVTTELEENETIFNAIKILQKRNEELKRRTEIAETKLIEQAPKVEVYNSICDSSTLQDLQTVAVTIGLKHIFKVLLADKIIEEKWTLDGKRYYKPYAEYSIYFELKERISIDIYGRQHIRPRIYVTGRGLTWLSKRYKAVVNG